MGKSALIAIGGGGLSALTSLLALSGTPAGAFAAYFAPLPLLLVGLGVGAGMTPLAGLVGIATIGAFGGLAAAALYGGLHALPSWLVVHQALAGTAAAAPAAGRWPPVGGIVCLLAALAAALSVLAVVVATGAEGVEASLRDFLQAALALALPAVAEADRTGLAESILPLFLGGAAGTWVAMMVVNSVLAQTLLAKRGWNLRPTPRWSDLTLPQWMAWPLVGAAAVAVIADGDLRFLARNLVVVFATPYFFLGLAVIHTLMRQRPARTMALTAFYLILGLFFVFAAAAVAAVGMLEQWEGIRRKFAGSAGNQEGE
jgi:hypothetical protein